MVRYSLDLDGVVADYFAARAEAAKKIGIRPLSQPVDLVPEDLDIFMRERQAILNTALREHISANLEEFFGGLGCLASPEDGAAIQRAAAQGHELFWVSSRSFFANPSFGARNTEELTRITLEWLDNSGFPADPAHVILTPDKAGVITDNDIRFHLDDAVAHVTSIALQSPAKVYLLRQPWNQRFFTRRAEHADGECLTSAGAYGIEEVDSIAEFITLMVGK
jgi:hypothetical protein